MTDTIEYSLLVAPCNIPFYNGLEEEGCCYFNARWYDAQTGRFTSEDPARDGSNWHIYVSNNPLRFTDSTGLRIDDDLETDLERDTDTNPGTGGNDRHQGRIDDTDSKMRNAKSLQEAEALYRKKLDLEGYTPIEVNQLNQRDKILNELAQLYGNSGLDNPGRWACAFLSSNYHIFDKLNENTSRRELIAFANSMNETVSSRFNKDVVGNDYEIGDYYKLFDEGIARNGGNSLSQYVRESGPITPDFSIQVYETQNGNEHIVAADSNGKVKYNPDPSIELLDNVRSYYFRWEDKE